MSAELKRRYTLEEYFELERNSEIKYEYWNGEIFAMSGASPEHEEILTNVISELKLQLKDRGCHIFSSNLRIKVPDAPPYKYPDLTAVCEKPEYELIDGVKTLTNPALIIEVLSPTTAVFDQGDKFTYYKSIPNFREYVLIAQDKPHLTLYVKQDENQWLQSEFLNLDDRVYLSSVDGTLVLREVYRGIESENFKA